MLILGDSIPWDRYWSWFHDWFGWCHSPDPGGPLNILWLKELTLIGTLFLLNKF